MALVEAVTEGDELPDSEALPDAEARTECEADGLAVVLAETLPLALTLAMVEELTDGVEVVVEETDGVALTDGATRAPSAALQLPLLASEASTVVVKTHEPEATTEPATAELDDDGAVKDACLTLPSLCGYAPTRVPSLRYVSTASSPDGPAAVNMSATGSWAEPPTSIVDASSESLGVYFARVRD